MTASHTASVFTRRNAIAVAAFALTLSAACAIGLQFLPAASPDKAFGKTVKFPTAAAAPVTPVSEEAATPPAPDAGPRTEILFNILTGAANEAVNRVMAPMSATTTPYPPERITRVVSQPEFADAVDQVAGMLGFGTVPNRRNGGDDMNAEIKAMDAAFRNRLRQIAPARPNR